MSQFVLIFVDQVGVSNMSVVFDVFGGDGGTGFAYFIAFWGIILILGIKSDVYIILPSILNKTSEFSYDSGQDRLVLHGICMAAASTVLVTPQP